MKQRVRRGMTTRKAQRSVSFYQAFLRSRVKDSYKSVDEFDWKKRLTDFGGLSWDEKIINGVRYDPILDRQYPILTMLEAFDPVFMKVIDADKKQVLDYMNEYTDSAQSRLANASAVAFLPKNGILAHVTSEAKIKKSQKIEVFINQFLRKDDYEWEVQALNTKDDFERFEKELAGVGKVDVSFLACRSLFGGAAEVGTIGQFFDAVSEDVNGDLTIGLQMELKNLSDQKAMGKLKAMVREILRLSEREGRKAKVKGEDLAGALVELDLIEHQIIYKKEFAIDSGRALSFTTLLDYLEETCSNYENEVCQM